MAGEYVIGGIAVKITSQNNQLVMGFKQAGKEVEKFGKTVTKTSKKVKSSSMLMAGAMGFLAFRAGRMVGRIAKDFLHTAESVEKLRISMMSLERDMAKGQATFDRLDMWAKNMPINTEEAVNQYRKLTAMGLKPTEKQMEAILDTVSALGGSVQTFQGISRALGQMASKGKIAGEEMRQLAEHGVPIYDILKKKLGLTGEALKNMNRTGITATEGLNAIFEELAERFGGTSKAMMSTWFGVMEMMKDRWWRFQRAVMEGDLFSGLKAGLTVFMQFFESNMDSLANFTTKFVQQLAANLFDIILGAASIIDLFSPLLMAIYNYGIKPMIEVYNKLPPEVKAVGLIASIVLGPAPIMAALAVQTMSEKLADMKEEAYQLLKVKFGNNSPIVKLWNLFGTASNLNPMSLMKNTMGGVIDEIGNVKDAIIELAGLEEGDFTDFRGGLEELKKKFDETLKKIKAFKLEFGDLSTGKAPERGMGKKGKKTDLQRMMEELNDKTKEATVRVKQLKNEYSGISNRGLEILIQGKQWNTLLDGVNEEGALYNHKLAMALKDYDEIQNKLERMTGTNQTMWDGITAGAEKFAEKTRDINDRWAEVTQVILSSVEQGFTDLFMSAAKGWEGIGEIATKVLEEILQSMIRIMIVQKIINGLFPGGPTVDGSYNTNVSDSATRHYSTNASAGYGVGHQGSGHSFRQRSIPRLHDGLFADEYRAILQKGEQVIPKGKSIGGTVINIIDQRTGGEPPEVTESTGPDGQRQIQVLIRSEMKAAMSDGSMDRTMKTNYNSRRGVR